MTPGSLAQASRRTVIVDGVLDDLAGVPGNALPADGQVQMSGYGGSSDLSGTVWFTYDEQNLYLSARITDDAHAQPAAGANIWQGDGIQFAVGSGAPGGAERLERNRRRTDPGRTPTAPVAGVRRSNR